MVRNFQGNRRVTQSPVGLLPLLHFHCHYGIPNTVTFTLPSVPSPTSSPAVTMTAITTSCFPQLPSVRPPTHSTLFPTCPLSAHHKAHKVVFPIAALLNSPGHRDSSPLHPLHPLWAHVSWGRHLTSPGRSWFVSTAAVPVAEEPAVGSPQGPFQDSDC